MGRKGAEMLDSVEEVQINFAAFRCPAPAPGLLTTLLWEFHPKTETRYYYEDGEFVWVGPFEGEKTVDFGGQIGEHKVYYIPHPETRTFPKTLGARKVSVHGCFPPKAMRLTFAMLESGLYRDDPITVRGVTATPFDLMYDILLQLPETKETRVWGYGLVVDVIGTKDGEERTVRFWNSHPPQEEWGGKAAYYKNIALPLSIGVQMIARGDVTARGVLPPEVAIDSDILFDELAKRGLQVHHEVLT
jgi:saccharopine dehydrogenase-like NADP-dependent oxidoreductase